MQSRLSEKLKRVGGVVERQHSKIEARADNIIAQEQIVERMTEDAFAPHEAMLEDAKRGLEDLRQQLGVLSNDPLQDSKEGTKGVQRYNGS